MFIFVQTETGGNNIEEQELFQNLILNCDSKYPNTIISLEQIT